MDERPLKPDSSIFGIAVADSSGTALKKEAMQPKEWISGLTIVLALTIGLFLLFNLRSR
jgi:hypothetical protein